MPTPAERLAFLEVLERQGAGDVIDKLFRQAARRSAHDVPVYGTQEVRPVSKASILMQKFFMHTDTLRRVVKASIDSFGELVNSGRRFAQRASHQPPRPRFS